MARRQHALNSPTTSVRVPKAAEIVADDIRLQILRGALTEGDSLPPESALVEAYGVSRPTLREALRILESQSLIEIRRGANGGARITMPSARDAAQTSGILLQARGTTIRDVFEARSVIEPAAVRMIVERGLADGIERLDQAHRTECTLSDDWASFNVEAAMFHSLVVEVAGNTTLALLNEMLVSIVIHHHGAMFRQGHAEFDALVASTVHYHGGLIEALREGDADAAEALWREHLDRASDAALAVLGDRTVIELFEEAVQ